ncbi:hypothetical protein B9Z55_010494 [Caenorhabditis nigoni]|uniref:Uncharacterized protein n=1 Tax=Caenorhabditis nigoni TaxID=1611254 RepID=A0A2G5UG22_9PELO|nr:hypothetical protein B9Z55_010494 [Caenorhabditis nigoni]
MTHVFAAKSANISKNIEITFGLFQDMCEYKKVLNANQKRWTPIIATFAGSSREEKSVGDEETQRDKRQVEQPEEKKDRIHRNRTYG